MSERSNQFTTMDKEAFENLCRQINGRLPKLRKKGLHVGALFQDNEHDNIIGWATLNTQNQVVEKFIGDDAIKFIFEKYL